MTLWKDRDFVHIVLKKKELTMKTNELIEELSKKPSVEIESAIVELMLKGKIEFDVINSSYIKFLELIRNHQKEDLYQAHGLLVDFLLYQDKVEKPVLDKALEMINNSRRFNADILNKKYNFEPKHESVLS